MIANLPAIVTSVGLVCVIIGACLVAVEMGGGGRESFPYPD